METRKNIRNWLAEVHATTAETVRNTSDQIEMKAEYALRVSLLEILLKSVNANGTATEEQTGEAQKSINATTTHLMELARKSRDSEYFIHLRPEADRIATYLNTCRPD